MWKNIGGGKFQQMMQNFPPPTLKNAVKQTTKDLLSNSVKHFLPFASSVTTSLNLNPFKIFHVRYTIQVVHVMVNLIWRFSKSISKLKSSSIL